MESSLPHHGRGFILLTVIAYAAFLLMLRRAIELHAMDHDRQHRVFRRFLYCHLDAIYQLVSATDSFRISRPFRPVHHDRPSYCRW